MQTVILAIDALVFAFILFGAIFLVKADRESVILAAMFGMLLALDLVALFS